MASQQSDLSLDGIQLSQTYDPVVQQAILKEARGLQHVWALEKIKLEQTIEHQQIMIQEAEETRRQSQSLHMALLEALGQLPSQEGEAANSAIAKAAQRLETSNQQLLDRQAGEHHQVYQLLF